MKYNIAAAVILYNPAKETISNIESYLRHVSLLVIVDNSDSPQYDIIKWASKNPDIHVISNDVNKGIATALNQGIRYASSKGFEWILTMDQDSYFDNDMITNYLTLFSKYKFHENIAIMGPIYENTTPIETTEESNKINTVITSGSIINISVYNMLKGFKEELFIDGVDHDYCFRARISGFNIIQFNKIVMNHNLGELVELRNFFTGKTKSKRLHSPVRMYYFVRNTNYIIKKYRKYFPEDVKKKDLLIRIKNNLLYGKKKIQILKSILKGWIDFKRNKFGPK
jgi:rhamnosyltransferase